MAEYDGLNTLRIGTLNLLAHPHALRERVQHLIDELNGQDLDFLLLQEVLRRKSAKFNIARVIADGLGLHHVAEQHVPGRSNGNITLSRHPLAKVETSLPGDRTRMLVTTSTVRGRVVGVINSHGAWGSFAGAARVAEALHADKLARAAFDALSPNVAKGHRPTRERRPIFVYGGDLNTVPDSAPVRYLTGRDVIDGKSTVWLDAWDIAGDGDGSTIGPTVWSEFENEQRLDTPYLHHRHPRERYDYLLVHEWSHGHAGDPLNARLFATDTFEHDGRALTISDHFGVLADLYLP